jgi:cytochrome c oxidase subunit 2
MGDPTTGATNDRRRRARRPIRGAILVWAVLTIAGILFAIFAPGRIMPISASTDDRTIRLTFIVFTIVSAPVAALVWGIGGYSLFAWRSGPKDPPPEDGPPIRRNSVVEFVWVTVSSVLTLFLLVWGLAALSSVSASAASDALIVDVTGQQWVWSYSYPEQHVQSQTLEVPVGREVIFRVTSVDVVHGFWIPSFSLKVDANPAVVTSAQTTPTRVGQYAVRCAELCGLYHSYMDSVVKVVSAQQFERWVAANGGTPPST